MSALQAFIELKFSDDSTETHSLELLAKMVDAVSNNPTHREPHRNLVICLADTISTRQDTLELLLFQASIERPTDGAGMSLRRATLTTLGLALADFDHYISRLGPIMTGHPDTWMPAREASALTGSLKTIERELLDARGDVLTGYRGVSQRDVPALLDLLRNGGRE